jgi:hypothetical protein
LSWQKQCKQVQEALGDDSEAVRYSRDNYSEDDFQRVRGFLNDISENESVVEGALTSEETHIYSHPTGRHILAIYNNEEVELRGHPKTVSKAEEVLTAENPLGYRINWLKEGASQITDYLTNTEKTLSSD